MMCCTASKGYCLKEYSTTTLHSLTLSCRSSLLPPFIHAMIPYFVYDCYAMYVTSALEEREKHPSLLKQFTGFVKKKLPFIVHHVLLCVLGYPIVVVSVIVWCCRFSVCGCEYKVDQDAAINTACAMA